MYLIKAIMIIIILLLLSNNGCIFDDANKSEKVYELPMLSNYQSLHFESNKPNVSIGIAWENAEKEKRYIAFA